MLALRVQIPQVLLGNLKRIAKKPVVYEGDTVVLTGLDGGNAVLEGCRAVVTDTPHCDRNFVVVRLNRWELELPLASVRRVDDAALDPADNVPEAEDAYTPRRGHRVEIGGFRSRADLNGTLARVSEEQPEDYPSKVRVAQGAKTMVVKRKNLVFVAEAPRDVDQDQEPDPEDVEDCASVVPRSQLATPA